MPSLVCGEEEFAKFCSVRDSLKVDFQRRVSSVGAQLKTATEEMNEIFFE